MVAIVGMAFKLPGPAQDLHTLWDILARGRDCIREIPPARAALLPTLKQHYPKWGGFLENVSSFDAGFFNISGLEARYMDPQQRLFLETVWRALEDGGIRAKNLWGTATGVFVGAHTQDYLECCARAGVEIGAYWNSGLNASMLANRVSYYFNFHGPSQTINTACSSGLEAFTRAVEAIRQGFCSNAVVGGVNLMLSPSVTISAARAGMLAADGRCKPFDAKANGFVRGEGVGALILKPATQAIADGDPIYATVRAAVSGHGGHAASLTAPNLTRQAQLLEAAYDRADIDPRTLTYVEAHGTGTKLGDPVEVEALVEAFKNLFRKRGLPIPSRPYCGLGSIKGNLGHLESAAGIAGLIKVLLCMRYRRLPPLAHFSKLNPMIDLSGSPFYIVSKNQAWPRAHPGETAPAPLRAGVSSFGFGGAYAHVVLEESLRKPAPAHQKPSRELVVLSARSEHRLRAYASDLLRFLDEESSVDGSIRHPKTRLIDLAFTLQTAREPMAVRLAMIATQIDELRDQLSAFLASRPHPGTFFKHPEQEAVPESNQRSSAPAEPSLEDIARTWAGGGRVNWPENGTRAGARRVSLPAYPFSGKSYWLPDSG